MTNYCTAADIRAALDNMSKTTYDTYLTNVLIPGVSETIDSFCNRPDGFIADGVASARYYTGDGGPVLNIDECVAISEVAVKDSPSDDTYTAWASDDWVGATGDPKRPNFNTLPYTLIIATATGANNYFTSGEYTMRRGFRPSGNLKRGVPTVRITAKWGYAVSAPARVKLACITQASRVFKRGLSAFADTLVPPEFGTLLYVQKLDPDVEFMLVQGRLKRPAIGRR